MGNLRTIMVLCLGLWSSSWAQENTVQSRLSPKLKTFLGEHPEAATILTNSFSEVFSNRTVGVYYFYSNVESEARAVHFFLNAEAAPEVLICVRENQQPMDEYVALLFETLNCTGDKRFRKLAEDARTGIISREAFATGVLRTEFEALQRTREVIRRLKIGTNEAAESYYYKRLLKIPATFDEFLSNTKADPSPGNTYKDYESKYEALRKLPAGK
jgi:hypothetical protein